MAALIEFEGVAPTIAEDVWPASTAVLIGDLRIGKNSSVWYGAVLRGDFSHIRIGAGGSIQDNVVIHPAEGLPTFVGDEVAVGHGSILEGCVVGDGAVVGMGSTVCQRSRVCDGAVVAAGSVLAERQIVDPLGAAEPARKKKRLDGAAAGWTRTSARESERSSSAINHQ